MKPTLRLRASLTFRDGLKRLRGEREGIAAVEFALILPLMVTLYLGCSEITQSVLASRKMAIVARTLSDLTAQQPTATTSPCTAAGMCDLTMTSIFSAATSIMTPFSTTAMAGGTLTLTMTVSSVEFVAFTAAPGSNGSLTWVPSQNALATSFTPTTTDPGYQAKVHWSKTAASPNNGSVRSCATPLTPVSSTTSPALTNLPNGLYGPGSIIISDVTYNYQPTFGGSVLAWVNTGGATYVAMRNTTYMRPRNWTTYITYPTQNGVGTSCTG